MSRYIITGNLGIPQNVSSTVSWLREYGPVLRRCDPEMSLTLAGKNPDKTLLKEAAEFGAKVIASPPDMSVILKEADVYICPSDNGSGIKLRIMDGLKLGLPVVAHKMSSRGYEKCLGSSMFVYDDSSSFIEAVKAARSQSADRDSLIDEYKATFSFKAGVERLKAVFQDFQR